MTAPDIDGLVTRTLKRTGDVRWFVPSHPEVGPLQVKEARSMTEPTALYGFTCGYCDERFDPPFSDADEAAKAAQEAGWRMTFGTAKGWGEGAHNTCPRCAEGTSDEHAIPIWVKP